MRRPRLSLLSLLLIVAVVASSLTTAMLWSEVGPFRREVSRLREEVGELDLQDPTRLHAMRVETRDDLEWKWRLWIPQGVAYKLRTDAEAIPAEGYPRGGGTIWLREPGELVVRYVIRRDARSGGWRGSLKTRGGSVGSDAAPWVEWPSRTYTSGGVGTSTRAFPADQTVDLIRLRVGENVKSTDDIADPAPGFVVWLEPL
ncbi:hypothetical protein [Botrimarina sp.]|uniref:hypothetical protein n=1 Tax=Botrimarina sp. TaxID=2795802 RepID=UPI0032EFBB86